MIINAIRGMPHSYARVLLGSISENLEKTIITSDIITSGGSPFDYSLYSPIATGISTPFVGLELQNFEVNQSNGVITYTGSNNELYPLVVTGRFVVNVDISSREMMISPFSSSDGGTTWRLRGMPAAFEHQRNGRDSTQVTGFASYFNHGEMVQFLAVQNDGQSISDVTFKAADITIV